MCIYIHIIYIYTHYIYTHIIYISVYNYIYRLYRSFHSCSIAIMLISQKLRFFIAWIDPWPPKDKNSHDDSEQQSERFRRVSAAYETCVAFFSAEKKAAEMARESTIEHHCERCFRDPQVQSISGWWFGTWILFFHSVGNFIIPTDQLIFFRGVEWGLPLNDSSHGWWLSIETTKM